MSRRSVIKIGKINRVRRLEARQWLKDIMHCRIMEMLLDPTPIRHYDICSQPVSELTEQQRRDRFAPLITVEISYAKPSNQL